MARPARIDIAGGVYHVTARGNEKRAVFRDDEDRQRYIERLIECRNRYAFRIFAFCLMGNHVHLALERGPVSLSKIMLALHSVYALRFNRRHDRVGHLFQGRYKAFLVDKDAYLLTLVRYIHLNPVKAGLVPRPDIYRWSSDRYYRAPNGLPWLDRKSVLQRLGSRPASASSAYRQLMASDADDYEKAVRTGELIKGNGELARRLHRNRGHLAKADLPPRTWTIDRVACCAAATLGLTVDQLRAGQRSVPSRQRAIAAYVAQKYARVPLARTARFFGRDESTFVHAVKRLERALQQDPSMESRVRGVVAMLESSGFGA